VRRLEARLVEDVRSLRGRDARGAILLIVPSRLLGVRFRAGIARALGGVAALHVLTLPELAERLAALPLTLGGRRPLPAVADRFLVDRAIRVAIPVTGGYFSRVASARNFPSALLRTLLDVKRAGLDAGDLEAALRDSAKIREVAACLRALDAELRRHGYHDASDLLVEATRLVTAEPRRLGARAVLVAGFVELNRLESRLLEACGRAAELRVHDATAETADLPPADAIEIVAAPGEEREVREIARVVLRHVEEGGRLDEIGILLRQPGAYLPAIRDVFGAAGVPYVLGAASPIGDTRAGRSLRLLVEARRADFARAAVMEFLAFADLRSRPGTSPAEWERLTRQAGIVGGAREWRVRLDRLGRRLAPAAPSDDDAGDPPTAALARDRDALTALRRVVRAMLRGLERLPDPGPLGTLVDGLARTFARLVTPSIEARQAIAALTRLRTLSDPDTEIPLEELWALVESALAAPADGVGQPTPGRVFVGELGSALGLDFPVTIVPGLVEGAFPAPPRQDPILLDEERRRLPGLPLAEEARALERARFALAIGSGARRVVLTYPRVDAESGRPRVPSFLALDLLADVTGRLHDFAALETFPGWRSVPLHPAPPGARARPLDEREWLVTRALEARAAPDGLLGELPAVRRGVETIRLRERTDALTAYDGLLGLGVDLGPRPLTPTALERYAACPFRYLLERVYGLASVEEPDRILAMEPRERGTLVHAILEGTYRRLAEANGFPLTRDNLAAAREVLRAVFDEACGEAERRGVTGLPTLWAGERARLHAELLSALEAEADDAGGWVPARFEAAFGVEWREGAGAPLAYRLPDGTEIQLCGTMDRVDLSPDPPRARVLDYKTGRVRTPRTADRLGRGRALQLPIYRLAAEAMLRGDAPDTPVVEAQYYHVIGPDAGARIRFTRDGWEARRGDFDRVLQLIVDGIRAGRFFQRPVTCAPRGPCAFDLACGAERFRWAEAKRADPAVVAHDALEAIP
jgi:hypothetical protein